MSIYIKTLEQFLNYCTEKNKVISNNISNAGTKNYKREDVDFKSYLQDNMSEGQVNKKFIPINQNEDAISKTYDSSTEQVSGLNNVDIDKEMSELATNSVSFKLSSKMMGEYFKTLQYVIKGDK